MLIVQGNHGEFLPFRVVVYPPPPCGVGGVGGGGWWWWWWWKKLYMYVYECISTPLPPVVWVVWVVVGGGGGRSCICMYMNVYDGMNVYF